MFKLILLVSLFNYLSSSRNVYNYGWRDYSFTTRLDNYKVADHKYSIRSNTSCLCMRRCSALKNCRVLSIIKVGSEFDCFFRPNIKLTAAAFQLTPQAMTFLYKTWSQFPSDDGIFYRTYFPANLAGALATCLFEGGRLAVLKEQSQLDDAIKAFESLKSLFAQDNITMDSMIIGLTRYSWQSSLGKWSDGSDYVDGDLPESMYAINNNGHEATHMMMDEGNNTAYLESFDDKDKAPFLCQFNPLGIEW